MDTESPETGFAVFWNNNVDLIVASAMVIAGTLLAAAGNRDIKDVMTLRKERKAQALLQKAEQELAEIETQEGTII